MHAKAHRGMAFVVANWTAVALRPAHRHHGFVALRFRAYRFRNSGIDIPACICTRFIPMAYPPHEGAPIFRILLAQQVSRRSYVDNQAELVVAAVLAHD